MNQNFHGDVAQAVQGDVKHTGPEVSNSNSVTLHINGVASPEPTASASEPLSWQQQEEIRVLVRAIADASDTDMGTIWRKFSAYFDGVYYQQLPKERYREADRWLNEWLDRVRATASTTPDTASTVVLPQTFPEGIQATPCAACAAAEKQVALIYKAALAVAVVALLAGFTAVHFARQTSTLRQAVAATEARLRLCEFEGRSYTVGSIIANEHANDVQCISGKEGSPPQWRAVDAGVTKSF